MRKFYIGILLCLTVNVFSLTDLELGWKWYNSRLQNTQGISADINAINNAIYYFKKAIQDDQYERIAAIGLLKSYYFKATFIPMTKKECRELYNTSRNLGLEMAKKYPDDIDLKFWLAVNWGRWAETHDVFTVAKSGVVDELKKLCEEIITMDPDYDKGAAYVFLGRMHQKTPNIPFIITWPSKKEAEKCFKKALNLNPENMEANLYYAELLDDSGKKESAVKILEKIINMTPAMENYLAEIIYIKEAEELLLKLKK